MAIQLKTVESYFGEMLYLAKIERDEHIRCLLYIDAHEKKDRLLRIQKTNGWKSKRMAILNEPGKVYREHKITAWCKENCNHLYYADVFLNWIMFENVEDAENFKLYWDLTI